MEAKKRPKLRTYVKIHDFSNDKILAKSPLSRYQRSLISQLKFGRLPLKIETHRYQGIPPDQRICRICNDNVPETEIHFLFECEAITQVRERALTPLKANIPDLGVNFENPFKLMLVYYGFQIICYPEILFSVPFQKHIDMKNDGCFMPSPYVYI